MSDEDSKLSGPNHEVIAKINRVNIPETTIKSDDEPVGGVQLGAFDDINLDSSRLESEVKTGVDAALKFVPTPRKNTALLSAIAQLRGDVVSGVSTYLTARSSIVKQLEPVVSRQYPSIKSEVDRVAAVNSIILERTLNARLSNIALSNNEILTANQELLRFHTSVSSTYMRQSLALQFHQLYNTKNLISVTTAFAKMVESKLEAIKINTKIPDISKVSILQRAKQALVNETFRSGSRAVLSSTGKIIKNRIAPAIADYIDADDRPDLSIKDRIRNAASRSADVIRRSKLGGGFVNVVGSLTGRTSEQLKQFMDRNNLQPDSLWERSSGQRKRAAGIIRGFAGTHSTESAVGVSGVPSGMSYVSSNSNLTKRDIKTLVSVKLDKIYNLLDSRLIKEPSIRANSFEDHKLRYLREFGNRGERGSVDKMTGGAGRGGVLGVLGSLLGGSGGGHSTGPVTTEKSFTEQALEEAEAATIGGALLGIGKKGLGFLGRRLGGVGRLAGRVLGLGGATSVATKAAAPAAAAAVGTGLKEATKFGTKTILKKIPLVGTVVGAGLGVNRLLDGDLVGALGEVASGLVSNVPLIGTAGSLFIDGALAARDRYEGDSISAGKTGDLFKARMKAYGAEPSNNGNIAALEFRSYRILTGKANKFDGTELRNIAKKFGFDLNNDVAVKYFNLWLSKRFYEIYQAYINILRKNSFTPDNETSMSASVQTLILDEFNRTASSLVQQYKDYVPSPGALQKFGDIRAKTISNAALVPRPNAQAGASSVLPKTPSGFVTTSAMAASVTRPVPSESPRPHSTTSTSGVNIEHPLVGGVSQNQSVNNTNVISLPSPPGATTSSSPQYMSHTSSFAPGSSGSSTALPTAAPSAHVANTERITFNPGGTQIGGQTWNQKVPTIMTNLMRDFDLTKEQAAGIVGNLGHECGGLTEMQEKNPVGGGRGGLGWAQWTGPRRIQYEAYCRANGLDTYSDAANYGFLKQELNGEYRSAIRDVKATSTTEGSMRAFEKRYEAAGIKHYESRQQYADSALKVFGSGSSSTSTGGSAPGTSPNTPSQVVGIDSGMNLKGIPGVTATPQTANSPGTNTSAPGSSPRVGNDNSSSYGGTSTLPRGVVGSGQCVDLVKQAAGVGHTSEWQSGGPVANNPDLKPGTAIAVFDKDGKYGNHTDGSSHAAIYLGPSKQFPGGIRVYDQWSGQPAHERDIRPNGSSPVNSASAYSVINSGGQPAIAKSVVGQDNVVASAETDKTPSSVQSTPTQNSPTPNLPSTQSVVTPTLSAPNGMLSDNNTRSGNRPGFEVPGPFQNIISPIRSATSEVQSRRIPPPAPPPSSSFITTHPDLISSSNSAAATLMKSFVALGDIHAALQGLHATMKDAHGPNGVIANMTDMLSKTAGQNNIFAPVITPPTPQQDTKKDDGLNVSKKRADRYAG